MFKEYVATDRYCGTYRFDFLISNDTAREWYDASPNQNMMERDWCLSKIKPGFVVVDCGAHHGMMTTLFAMATGPKGRVFAYDVLPSNAEMVRRNVALNSLSNVAVRAVGVGELSGRYNANNNSGNVMVADADDVSGDVEIVRLDDDLPQEITVDFLKIDVEGHEVQALRGMRRILLQRPIIDLEIHNFAFSDRRHSLRQIASMLRGYEFSLLERIGDHMPVNMGQKINMDLMQKFENPHLFCTPKSRVWRLLSP